MKHLTLSDPYSNLFFYRMLDERHRFDKPVELIVKVGAPDNKDCISKEGRQVTEEVLQHYMIEGSKIHWFEYIPYVTFQTTTQNASSLAEKILREGYLLSKEKKPVVSDVDVSHVMAIPEDIESIPPEDRKLIRKLSKMNAPKFIIPRGRQSDDDFNPPEGRLWNLKNVYRYDAEDIRSKLGENVRVAIIDTGCDFYHIEIRRRFNSSCFGYNFVEGNTNPSDDHGHGTHVAGSVAGIDVGVAPYTILYALKVLGADGYGSEANVVQAIEWCITNDIDAANMSLGGPSTSTALERICEEAKKRGVILIAAAGNNYVGKSYPASLESVLSVAAVDREKRHAEFSNINSKIDVSGPGVDILSCKPNGKYAKHSGTSMAAPHATGVMACGLMVYKPGKDAQEVDEMFNLLKDSCYECMSSGSPMMDSWMYGNGHVNTLTFMNKVTNEML